MNGGRLSMAARAYIVGELWGNASDYVRPDLFDAVMNYAFHYFPVERFICAARPPSCAGTPSVGIWAPSAQPVPTSAPAISRSRSTWGSGCS